MKKYLKRHEELTALLERLEKEKADRINKSKVIAQFIKKISKQGVIFCFDADLWNAVIENVVVGIDGKLTFRFKNGVEIVI